ncbi:MAG: CocE/NonD family hydrolase [Planctomycetota bacterium]|nr:CocE/NonD family hydrolase [Planctomycetota bacterium]
MDSERRWGWWLCVWVVCCVVGTAAEQPEFKIKDHYTKSQHMVPMRDGTRLFTTVYQPIEKSRPYPVMLFRTPYSTGPYEPEQFPKRLGPSLEFAREGYLFVYQDVRGKFRSEGTFVVMKPLRSQAASKGQTDESTDTYDTIEWILNQVPGHNGRVGQWGISYPGWQTVMGMIDAHPALRASSPQASPADMFIGDDFHHNGAFRLMYTFHWLARNAAARSGPRASRGRAVFEYGTPDSYQFFLDLGPVANVNRRYFKNRVPTWNEYMEHPNYDEYWRQRDALRDLKGIKHPVLHVAGWFDAEDFYGPMSIYYTVEEENPENQSTLVVGPWRHGGWAAETGESLGDIRFGARTSEYFRQQIEFPFFQYHLKDQGTPPKGEAIVFETGANQWRSYDHWPPKSAQEVNLYFQVNGQLSFSAPQEPVPETSDMFVSDPRKPVPFSAAIRNTQGHTWMVEDQRFASRRSDVLVYQTEPLQHDVVIAGPIIASLQVAVTGTDADWIVKLIDVYPSDAPDDSPRGKQVRMGGYQMLVAGEVMRSRFRNSFEDPQPLVPGEVTAIEYDLRDKYHCFLKGHRIMVQVQSTWFPVIGRNPQRFVDTYHASAEDFQAATHQVFRSAQHPSHLKLHVLPAGEQGAVLESK